MSLASRPLSLSPCLLVSLSCLLLTAPLSATEIDCDLLVVGGSEAGVAAAVQAARLGVASVVLVNDIDWLGGQFTSEGLCAIDEWTVFQTRRTWFPRSGLFLEVMDRIEEDNQRKYGLRRPGNCWCAWTTCEPRDTEQIFRALVKPHLAESGGPLRIIEDYEPAAVEKDRNTVVSVRFTPAKGDGAPITVRAKLTIDASDWGDVVRLSQAKYSCGPDPWTRFHEQSAPQPADVIANEMNPIAYCLVMRESPEPAVIEKPANYDERSYFATTSVTRLEFDRVGWLPGVLKPFAQPWKDTALPGGPYTGMPTVYHHRRLVDRRHHQLAAGSEAVLLNWPVQDYPLMDFPQRVVDALEATGPGTSQKNIVDMTPAQRRIVFADAKNHALGMVYSLQTTVYEKQPFAEVSFRNLRLTDEFGTADHLPPKPYVREGLRTEALYMMREADVRDTDNLQSWARHMVPDNVFGFQFNIDFHPTRRTYLDNDRGSAWSAVHTAQRNWNASTDRAGFALRSLVPLGTDGLLVAGKNLGMTSIVQAAVRLHAHGMHSGQAAATIAACSLEDKRTPRMAASDGEFIRRVQAHLLAPPAPKDGGQPYPGVLLWPYQDVAPDAQYFVAANQLAVRAIMPGDPNVAQFFPNERVTRREAVRAITRAALSVGRYDDFAYAVRGQPRAFEDVPPADPDYPVIDTLAGWKVIPPGGKFEPDAPASDVLVAELFRRLGWQVLADQTTRARPITRAEFAMLLWDAIAGKPEKTFAISAGGLIGPATDAVVDGDHDRIPDLDDPLPRDNDNDNLPDRLDPDRNNNGTWDRAE